MSVLLLHARTSGAPALVDDFRAAGFSIAGEGDCAQLVGQALRAAPDVLVLWAPRLDAALLQSLALLQAQQPVPVLAFTDETDVDLMRRALEAGVHAWVVQGYAPHRLRALVQLARSREARERHWRERLAALEEKLDERKWLERAKGILMRARQLSEEEAFRLLRTASMQANRKVGEVSRDVIAAARTAAAINRAGQQRMLSQRLVKLHALACSGTDPAAAAVLIRQSVQRIDDNLAALEAELSAASYGDLVACARAGWRALRPLLQAPLERHRLAKVDALAEAVLQQADALVLALQGAGEATQVGVINLAGRQRMLSQRAAKLALLGGDPGEAALAFEQGLARLAAAPLSTPEIRTLLARGESAWQALRTAMPDVGEPPGRLALAAASEELLAIFDRLTEAYQHSIEVLMGS